MKTRNMRLSDLPRREKRDCRWCGAAVPKGRRRWCGQACVNEYMVRARPGHAAQQLLLRDRGICGRCGTDCARLERIMDVVSRGCGYGLWPAGYRLTLQCDCPDRLIVREVLAALGFGRSRLPRRLWDVHHRVAVRDGGGQCGLDGLETLCRACHLNETRRQRAVWSERRSSRG